VSAMLCFVSGLDSQQTLAARRQAFPRPQASWWRVGLEHLLPPSGEHLPRLTLPCRAEWSAQLSSCVTELSFVTYTRVNH
jgi:hypothetical protein